MNMEDTKKCPYCGEEIKAVAKKCMHCGEWLDEEHKVIPEANNASYAEVPNSENKGNDGKIEVYSLDSPISPYAIILFYLAMLFCFVSMIQNMGLSHIGSRYDFVIEYCNYVPEWVVNLGIAIICVVFAYGLYTATKSFSDPMTNLLKSNIGFYVLLGVFNLLADILPLQENLFFLILFLFLWMFGMVVTIMIATKIINNYRGYLNNFGWYSILFIAGESVLGILLPFIDPGSSFCIVLSLLVFGAEYLYFKILSDLFY